MSKTIDLLDVSLFTQRREHDVFKTLRDTAPANSDGVRVSRTASPITSAPRSATSTVDPGSDSHCSICWRVRAGPSKGWKKSGRPWR